MWKAILFAVLFFGALYWVAGVLLGSDCSFCTNYIFW
jgi:hypothetical protein